MMRHKYSKNWHLLWLVGQFKTETSTYLHGKLWNFGISCPSKLWTQMAGQGQNWSEKFMVTSPETDTKGKMQGSQPLSLLVLRKCDWIIMNHRQWLALPALPKKHLLLPLLDKCLDYALCPDGAFSVLLGPLLFLLQNEVGDKVGREDSKSPEMFLLAPWCSLARD